MRTTITPRQRERAGGERGATAAEYAVIIGAIAAVVLVGVALVGTATFGLFSEAEEAVDLATVPETVEVVQPATVTEAVSDESAPPGDTCPDLPGIQPPAFDCSLPLSVRASFVGNAGGKVKYACPEHYQLVRGQKLELNKVCVLTTVGQAAP